MSIAQVYDENDGLGLAGLVQDGSVSPEELLEEALGRMARLNPRLGAVVVEHADYARAQIRRGLPEGPFRGVPFLLKDLVVQLQGTETSNGSRFFAGHVAEYDSTVVKRYLATGVTIFGKTSSPELGLSGTSDPVLYGPTRNPWDLALSAGGSSGGSAAAVAARIVPIAHGSDGGGSIRVPASVCGLVGLKPTRARTPSGPLRGEGWAGLSSHHVITRTVRDCAAMLDATAGEEAGDPYQVAVPQRPFLAELNMPPGSLRVGMNTTRLDGTAADPEVIEAMAEVVTLLEGLGHRVDTYRPDISLSDVGRHFGSIVASNVAYTLRLRADELGRVPTASDVERLTWYFYELGQTAKSVDYVAASVFAQQLGRQMARLHERFDVLLGPTCTVPAMSLGTVNMNGDIAAHTEALRRFVPSIAIYNMTGQPSISLPLSWSAQGVPIGSMFTAAFGQEALLFRLASELEQARPWKHRWPAIARDGTA